MSARKATALTVALTAGILAPGAQALYRNDGMRQQPPTRVITVQAPDTFHWSDAGIGVGGTLGVVVLATGTGLLLQRRRNRMRLT